MADKRAYFKVDVGYLSNPKVAAVAYDRPTAVLLHIASMGYAAQHLTDGIVPIGLLLRITGSDQADADTLLDAGLWHELDGGRAEIHDYLEHQRSAADTKDATEKAKRAADARWNASSNALSMPDAMRPASEEAMPRERERERDIKDVSAADAPDAPRDDVTRVCDHLADRIEANGSKRPTIGKTWTDSARLLIDKDERAEDEIHRAIDWCQDDTFWRGNVLSMPKFREKFDQMRLQAERTNVHPLRPSGEGPNDWMRRRPTT